MLVGAAVLIIALGAAHSYLGERFILTRLFRITELPRLFGSDSFTRHTLRFAWHLTSVAWWGIAALLLGTADSGAAAVPAAQIGSVISATSLVSAVVAFVGSRGRHLSWAVFILIAVLVWLGTHS